MEKNLFSIFNTLFLVLSEKKEGTMKSPDKFLVRKNKKSFLNKLNINSNQVVFADLIHGKNVEIVTKKSKRIIKETDALITEEKNLFLSVTVADCLPIFLFDKEKKVIGLIHGGWKSLSKNILSLTVKKMENNFNSNPKNILAGIGPGISKCCFEVKEDLLREFEPFLEEALKEKGGKAFLDLKKIAKNQLIESGLKEKNIEINKECTFCLSDKYFSFRRSKKKEVSEAMIALMGIVDKK